MNGDITKIAYTNDRYKVTGEGLKLSMSRCSDNDVRIFNL